MIDAREEARRQLEYIDRELERGQHDDPGRANRLRARRAELLKHTAARGSKPAPESPQ